MKRQAVVLAVGLLVVGCSTDPTTSAAASSTAATTSVASSPPCGNYDPKYERRTVSTNQTEAEQYMNSPERLARYAPFLPNQEASNPSFAELLLKAVLDKKFGEYETYNSNPAELPKHYTGRGWLRTKNYLVTLDLEWQNGSPVPKSIYSFLFYGFQLRRQSRSTAYEIYSPHVDSSIKVITRREDLAAKCRYVVTPTYVNGKANALSSGRIFPATMEELRRFDAIAYETLLKLVETLKLK